jgi:hypothetical protein
MSVFITNAPAGEPQYARSERLDAPPPTQIVAQADPSPKRAQCFTFPQQIIPLDEGRTLLRLRQPPTLKVNTHTMEFEAEDWGITMPCDKVEDLPRRIARRFLTLFSKADQESMEPQEKLEWLKLLDKVDYAQFSIDRSAPQYLEGTLVGKTPPRVEWHDGATEVLSLSLASSLFPLDPGDNFSAFVKVGRDNRTLSIERVSLIPA